MHRPRNDDQPARLVRHPSLQGGDLQFIQPQPVGIERDDRVVLEELHRRRRESVEHVAGLLSHAFFARLQQDIDRRVVLVAKQHVAEILVFPCRSPGNQQHAGPSSHHVHARRLAVVARFDVLLRRLDLQRVLTRSHVGGRHLEADRHDLTVGGQSHGPLFLQHLLRAGIRVGGHGSGGQFDVDEASLQAEGRQVARDGELVARVDTFRCFQVHHAHVQRFLGAPQPDREDGDAGRFRGRGRGLRIQARVAAAVRHQHDPRDRSASFLVDDRAHGVADARRAALQRQLRLPGHVVRFHGLRVRRVVASPLGWFPLGLHDRGRLRPPQARDLAQGQVGRAETCRGQQHGGGNQGDGRQQVSERQPRPSGGSAAQEQVQQECGRGKHAGCQRRQCQCAQAARTSRGCRARSAA